MLHVYLDVSTLNPLQPTGIGVYTLQLLLHLIGREDLQLVPVVRFSRYQTARAIRHALGIGSRVLCPLMPLPHRGAVFHGPDFRLPVRQLSVPKVITFHDMIAFDARFVPAEFRAKRIAELQAMVSRRDVAAIIAVSEFTAREVLHHFPHLNGRVHVVHLGSDRFPATQGTARASELALPERYILMVGTLERRKNIVGAISAFEIAKRRGIAEQLVLVGGWGFGSEEIRAALQRSPVKSDIICLGFVSDEHLPQLYSRARALLFPSWYEGFGLPALEAMQFGCPVIASNCGALPETCGTAAVYVDPSSPERIADALCQVLSDSIFRQQHADAGRQRAALMTWDVCAEQTVGVYRKVVSGETGTSRCGSSIMV
ncbi:MAG: glycosyltransferase family 4 protein [Chlorobi bacterium]|nr:glycosyltransferase family 4 protein [Chlorobiota bacterium]